MCPDPVLYPVAQLPLVGLELYEEIPSFLSDHVDDVRAASVRQHGSGQGLAVNADYLHASLAFEHSGVIVLGELPHPLCHGQLVYPTLDTAQRSLRRHSVPEHAHLAEPVQVVPAEFYYFGTRDMPLGAAEHHQHYDVGQSVADVPLVRPAEIGDGRGDFISSSRMLPWNLDLFCHFEARLSECAPAGHTWSSDSVFRITV